MIIGVCTLEIYLPGVGSLKEKRSIVKSLLARARQQFNISIAEVDDHDSHGRAVLGIACVSTEGAHAHRQIETVVRWIEDQRPDLPLGGYEVELL
jgi:uncharacterized protein